MVAAAVFGGIFAVIGVILIIKSIQTNNKIKSCREVEAVIVDLIKSRQRSDGRTYTNYTPVYEYYDGEPKQYKSSVSSNITKPVGTAVTLYISESGKVYEKQDCIIKLVIGVIFTLVGALFAVLSFM